MLESLIPRHWRAVWAGLRLAALGGIVYGIAVTGDYRGSCGQTVAVLVCTVPAAGGWLCWVALTVPRGHQARLAGALAALVIGGSALAGIDPSSPALALCGTGAAVAAVDLAPGLAVTLTAAGIAALATAAAATGAGQPGRSAIYAVALAAILLGGFNRRQFRTRLEQAEQLLVHTRRAQAEQARAAALEERARIAREIHDVLAHALGALAIQLEAADALLTSGRDAERAHAHVARARSLAVGGLAETRQAIAALRDGTLPLAGQLSLLASSFGIDTGTSAAFTTSGSEREVPPEVALAAYRTAQEAISNARKHAGGAPVTIALGYRDDGITLIITDHPGRGRTAPPAGLEGTGGGYGLTGLAERAALLGGELTAAPEQRGSPSGSGCQHEPGQQSAAASGRRR